MAAYWPSVAADGCVCLLVAATSWSCQLSLVHGLSIIVSGIRPVYVRSIARSWCQDCACHMTAVLFRCGVSSACEVRRQLLDEEAEHVLGVAVKC